VNAVTPVNSSPLRLPVPPQCAMTDRTVNRCLIRASPSPSISCLCILFQRVFLTYPFPKLSSQKHHFHLGAVLAVFDVNQTASAVLQGIERKGQQQQQATTAIVSSLISHRPQWPELHSSNEILYSLRIEITLRNVFKTLNARPLGAAKK